MLQSTGRVSVWLAGAVATEETGGSEQWLRNAGTRRMTANPAGRSVNYGAVISV
jgi:hypothetical protein